MRIIERGRPSGLPLYVFRRLPSGLLKEGDFGLTQIPLIGGDCL